jgi:anti-anti-sigma regulatory factor
MASSDDILTIHLSKPTTPEALRAFRAEVVRLLEAGTKALLVDIDEVGTLDSPTIAALIVALRAARERSAVLSLRVSRKNLLETLRITALDQVFTIVLPLAALAEAAPAKRVRRPRQRRTVAAIAWMAAITILAGARTEALPDVAPTDVVRNVAAQNAYPRLPKGSIGSTRTSTIRPIGRGVSISRTLERKRSTGIRTSCFGSFRKFAV